jgi:MoaA/NifB/PqqE/SkfB family radical SAM enzyme
MREIYTSTGRKLMHHPEVIAHLKHHYARPISIQIAPTSKCNLNCVFCSNVNRSKHESLDADLLIDVLDRMVDYEEFKTIEWTGGGDPTQWEPIALMIQWASGFDLEQGFITNGVDLKKIDQVLAYLKWIRISMNCLDYVDGIEIPKFNGTLGFSYVMNAKTTKETLGRLDDHVKRYRPKYVRIVPNCQASDEEQANNNTVYSEMVRTWGPPYFYQAKTFHKPDKCWWCYLKPFILHDGWVYPCSSVVLNEDAERQFHDKYRWVKLEDLPSVYGKPMVSFPTGNCNHCVFYDQNAMVDEIMHPNGMENFI